MATIARRRTGGAGVVGGGLWALGRLVRLVTSIVVGLIVIGILLVVLKANPGNDLVHALLDAARFLTTPFHNVFHMDNHRAMVAVNWGLAAVVYAFVGGFVSRLLRR